MYKMQKLKYLSIFDTKNIKILPFNAHRLGEFNELLHVFL